MPFQPSIYDRFEVLRYIVEFIATNNKAPTRNEIAQFFKAPRSSIQKPVDYLNANGYIRITKGRRRNIEVMTLGQQSVEARRLLDRNEEKMDSDR